MSGTALTHRDRPRTVIEPARGAHLPDFRELWERRELLWMLVRRDIAVRYKQSALGGLWAIVQPASLAVVFSVFLGLLAHVKSERHIPYPVFAVSGMVMWLLFVGALSSSSTSTFSSAQLIGKVYFPRLIIPLAASLPFLLDFAVAFVVVVVVTVAYGIVPPVQVLLVPLAALLALATALGVGLWFSALHVRYHDIPQVVPFVVLVGLFVTPILYPFSLVPHALQPIYAINPMVGVLEFYRWAIFPSASWPGWLLAVPVSVSVLLLVTGTIYFQRAQHQFADVI